MVNPRTAFAAALLLATTAATQNAADCYSIDTYPYDESFPLEVGAMAALADGSLLVGTRTGEVLRFDNVLADDLAAARVSTFASGLAQPLGFCEVDGAIYVAQRGELTRMRDRDGDGRADSFENVCDDWEISGNYHEYNFGPRVDADGNLWVTLNKPFGGEPYGRAHWRGWAVKIDPRTGVMQPIATGLRSPAGVEISPWGGVFYTDNQGEWCNASKLSHIEFGEFHGHPHGLFTRELAGAPFAAIPDPVSGTWMKDLHESVPQFKMPAVWFPYDKMGKSPSGMCWDRTDALGFGDQLYVGDQHHASVMRVFLEQVDGHWQGACFPFRDGFDCGITRICFGHDGSLFVGMTNAGWSGKGTRRWGLQRLRWNKRIPFAIRTMRATAEGFDLEFTRPVDPRSLGNADHYRMQSYTYRLEQRYGGPEGDKAECDVEVFGISADHTRVRLRVRPLRPGYVHELLAELLPKGGDERVGSSVYYTLVRRPRG